MQRRYQYGMLGGLFAVCLGLGLWGFTATGGGVPWAKRSARTLQEGLNAGSGSLIDIGRGIVIAGPIRKGGLVAEFGLLVLALAAVAVGLYVYAGRRGRVADGSRRP